jgi:predicted adenylyl cyclase CyaB
MHRNVEIKVSLVDFEATRARVQALTKSRPTEIYQTDTFFNTREGRLKVRHFSNYSGELIFYSREDVYGPKLSSFLRIPTNSPNAVCEALNSAVGQLGKTIKQRLLFMYGRTRIHLDRVQDLGDFLELEVMLTEGETEEDGRAEANVVATKLGIASEEKVDCSYIDLIISAQITENFKLGSE